MPLTIRAEAVLGNAGTLVGFVVSFADQSDAERTAQARSQLEHSLHPVSADADEIVQAIMSNATMAAMDIADGQHDASSAPQLHEVEQSAHRAARLYRSIRGRS
jgi:hypothetical protein